MDVPERITQQLTQWRTGADLRFVTALPSGLLVMAPYQFWPGYCILMADPAATNLNALTGETRQQFLADMGRVGDALIEITEATRANYAIYGNLDPYLHAHIWPRRADEPESVRTTPPLAVPAEIREAAEHAFDPARHGDLRDRLRVILSG